ncbi:hypothetical protein BH10BAC5_BH10BAC5_22360 [soil metagenome]
MDFLDQLVIPPNETHVQVLKFIFILSSMLFSAYIGILFGSSMLATFFNKRYKKSHYKRDYEFARDLMDVLTASKNVGIGLGMIPVFSITFVYAQLLFESKGIAVALMLFSAILFIIGISFIYKFKSNFDIEGVVESLKGIVRGKGESSSVIPVEIEEYEYKVRRSKSVSGFYANIFLIIAIWMFEAGTYAASNVSGWNSEGFFNVVFAWETMLNTFYFFSWSFAITGVSILFFFFKWQGGLQHRDEPYMNYVKKTGALNAFFGCVILPVFMFINFMTLPGSALSFTIFLYAGLALMALLLVCNLLYATLKNLDLRYTTAAFIIIMFVVLFSALRDNAAISASLKEHLVTVNVKAEEYEKSTKVLVVNNTGINGEEIYNTRCSACHKFDTKLVGPPYKETLPKYNDNVKKLASFIYNPVKVNPDYPPMPNQGLKPKEAEAIAQWILTKVKEYK